MMNRVLWIVVFAVSVASPALAQRGDRGQTDQPEVWKQMDVPPAPPLSPEESLKAFKIMPGFRVELVAAEPLVEDPVAMDFDAAGRLYVVEMRGFMPNVDGTGEDARNGRVVRLEDIDGDGRMDKSVVFLDGLQLPRAVAVMGDGAVLVGEPPNLWLCRDSDGDGKADVKEQAFKGYGSQGPVEHTDNGLLQAIDNRIYNAKSDKRFVYTGGKLSADKTRFRGQWGIAQDNYGRLYHNSNSDYLRADLIPSEYLDRNPHHSTSNGLNHRVVADQSVHSIRVNPGVNRGYQAGTLRSDGRLRNTTAVSGAAIYRGDQFGEEYTGDALVPEPAGNVVALFDLREEGLSITGKQVTTPDEKWGQRAFLASTDERFRPVSVYNGPDGALYVVDMYRGILQHKVYVTTYLRKQILERGLDKPVGMGRIYRIVREDSPIDRTAPKLDKLDSVELVKQLGDANGWTRDMAQRMLVARRDEKAIAPLRAMVRDEKASPLGRMHAIWTLAGVGAIEPGDVVPASKPGEGGDTGLRIAAIRVGIAMMEAGGVSAGELSATTGPIFAAARDADPTLRTIALHALSYIAASDLPEREPAADLLVRTVAGDPAMLPARDALLCGSAGREVDVLARLAAHWRGEKAVSRGPELVQALSSFVMRRGKSDEIAALLDQAAKMPQAWQQIAVLNGMYAWSSRAPKRHVDARPASIAALVASSDKKVAELAGKVDTERLAYGSAEIADVGPRKLTEKEQKLFEHGEQLYTLVCAACHQPHGKGLPGLAPSLVGTEWVNGDPAITTRIVLHGLMGPIEVDGEKWELVMPGHAVNPMFTDEATAGVLTYIRRSWENDADPVTPEFVQKVREATKDRVEPWTVKELKR